MIMVVVEAVGDVEKMPSSSVEGRRTDSFARMLGMFVEEANEREREKGRKKGCCCFFYDS